MIIDNLFTLQENSEHKPGSPYDRGGADAWYHRGPRPHKIVDGQEVTLTDPAEIAQYHQGFQDEGVTGRHQGKQYDESQSGVEEGSSEETLTTNVVKQWEKMHRPDAEQQAAKDAWVAKAAKALTQPKKKMPKKGVAEDVGDQWSVECQGKEYKCNDETHAVNKARSLINYGGQSAIIKQNAKPKYKWALGQKMEPVVEGRFDSDHKPVSLGLSFKDLERASHSAGSDYKKFNESVTKNLNLPKWVNTLELYGYYVRHLNEANENKIFKEDQLSDVAKSLFDELASRSLGSIDSARVGDRVALLHLSTLGIPGHKTMAKLDGFLEPKEIVKIHNRGSLQQLEFADGSRYPEKDSGELFHLVQTWNMTKLFPSRETASKAFIFYSLVGKKLSEELDFDISVQQGVTEARPTRHSMPWSVWNTKSPQDQEFLLKQHPNLVITDKPKPVKPQREKINYGEIANKIEQVVGNTFPDGDPLDWLLPYMRRRWGTDHNAMQHLDRAARRVLGARNYYDYLETVWDQVADDELVPNVSHKNNPWRVSEARHVHTTKQDWMGLPNLGDPAKVDVQRDWKKPTTQTHCPGCYSQDIKTYSDGEKECNQCHKTWDVKGVAEGRFEEPLTGWHIVSRAHDQVVRGTPSFATQDQAQKYLMNKMFANHQDFKVVHTAGVAEATQGQCPPATQDITLNLKNRQKAIDEYGYGPLNPDLPNDKFWTAKVKEWNLDSAEEAKQSLCGNCAAFDQRAKTLDCIAQGIDRDDPQDAAGTIDAGDLGYCKFLKFKCASRRTCDAWVTGGPLTDHTDNAQSQLEEKWSNKYKRSINCDHPRGFSQRAHCAGRNKNEDSGAGEQRWVLYLNSKPASHYSNKSDAQRDAEAVTQRLQSQGQSVPKIEILPHQRGLLEGQDVDLLEVAQVMTECLQRDTQQALPALQTYMRRRWGLISDPDQCLVQAGELLSEDLRKWFREKWVRFNPQGKIMGPCARGSSQEGKPKCLPQSKAHSLGKRGRASAAARKRREDPNPERRGAARNVATKKKSVSERCWDGYRQAGTKRKGSKQVPNCVPVSEQRCPHCGGAMVNDPVLAEKQDACYHKVRSRYKVWPSAYASGALVQCRKRGAANWGNKSK